MALDNEGFITLDPDADGRLGARKVVEFAQVRGMEVQGKGEANNKNPGRP